MLHFFGSIYEQKKTGCPHRLTQNQSTNRGTNSMELTLAKALRRNSLTHSLTHSSSSLLGWSIRPRNNNCHSSRSLATCSTTFQLVHPSSFRSLSIVFLHVVFGLPRFLLPSGAQVSATLQLLSFSLLNT